MATRDDWRAITNRREFDAGNRQECQAGYTALVLLDGMLECGYVPAHLVGSVRAALKLRNTGRERCERAMQPASLGAAAGS